MEIGFVTGFSDEWWFSLSPLSFPGSRVGPMDQLTPLPPTGHHDDEPSFDAAFERVLRQVYRGETWQEVEPYAERAWVGFEVEAERPWREVRERFAKQWPY